MSFITKGNKERKTKKKWKNKTGDNLAKAGSEFHEIEWGGEVCGAISRAMA